MRSELAHFADKVFFAKRISTRRVKQFHTNLFRVADSSELEGSDGEVIAGHAHIISKKARVLFWGEWHEKKLPFSMGDKNEY